VFIVGPFELLELGGRDDLRHVEKGVALEAYVNKGGLHAGEHLRDPALVDVADHPALILALDEDLDDLVVLEYGHARVVTARGDDHLLVHGQNSGNGATTPRAGARRGSTRRARTAGASSDLRQFVKRRILTLRTRPKVAI